MTELLASPADLADYRGVAYDPTDFHAVKLLEAASAFIRADTLRDFSLTEDEELVLNGSGRRSLVLPRYPVVAVSDVTLLARSSTDEDEELDADTDFRLAGGILWRIGVDWPSDPQSIGLTCTSGDSEVPSAIRNLCTVLAARSVTDPTGSLTGETIGGYSYNRATGPDGTVVLIAPQDQRVLDRYRLIVP